MIKVCVGSLLGLFVTLSAHAEGTRYLVKFKSQTMFNSVVTQMRHSSPSVYMNPRVENFRILNQTTKNTEALENVGLLIVETDEGVADLQNNPQIELVEKEIFHPAPAPIGSTVQAVVDIESHRDRRRPNIIPVPWGVTAVKAPAVWRATKGEGVRVLVLDTGLDADHPALRDRLVKGRNFMEAGGETEITDLMGHGTHVAGTILATGERGHLIGVAPRAQLYVGRVCSKKGCSSIGIASGVNWGIEEGVHVMNLSLGGTFATPAEQVAFRHAEIANIVVVGASGNESQDSVNYPAALPDSLAVGAVDAKMLRASFSNYGPELAIVAPGVETFSSIPRGSGRSSIVSVMKETGAVDIESIAFQGSPLGTAHDKEVVFCNLGRPADFARLDARGKIALVARGEISFKEKALNAIEAGAAAIVIYNNTEGMLRGSISDGKEIGIPALLILKKDGEVLARALSAGGAARMSAGVIATDYEVYQGTSMATPHVSGVAALVRSANPGLSAAQVRALLKDTAEPLGPNDANEYGSGFVNAEKAVKAALVATPDPVRLANGF